MRRRLSAAALLVLPWAVGATAPRATGEDSVLEPRSPWLFFSRPDERTAGEIQAVMDLLKDVNTSGGARDRFVLRYGLVAAPQLTAEVRRGDAGSAVWSAELTIGVLRDEKGPARELWPSIDVLLSKLRDAREPYTRAFAALALGCFHGPDSVPRERPGETGSDVRVPERMARDGLREARRAFKNALFQSDHDLRVAAALAIAKQGSDPEGEMRRAILDDACWQDDFGVAPRQAVLVTLGLLPLPPNETVVGEDEPRLLTALKDEETPIRRAAALAAALQAVHRRNDEAPRWVGRPTAMLEALSADPIRPALEDGAEAVFARGVIALRSPVPEEWRSILRATADPLTEERTAIAASQVLVFCPEDWLPGEVVKLFESGVEVSEPVRAAWLLVAGQAGTPEGITQCREWLSNKAKRPLGKPEWDVRYHAVVGILRALVAGRPADKATRDQAIEALDVAVSRGLLPGEFRDRLERVMKRQKARLVDAAFALPDEEARYVEHGFTCPYGLSAHDIEDVAVLRLNGILPDLFQFHAVKGNPGGPPDKRAMPQRFLKICIDAYPYFHRRELRGDRGRRPAGEMEGTGDPEREVREPK